VQFLNQGASAMTKIAFLFALLFSILLVFCLPAAPAQATGAPRTFVSAAGSDTNNCTNVATPCRHLAAAFAATAADGEIYVLDPANYGSLTITHGVSIEGHGWASIAPQAFGNAITINANTGDKINIIGVVLDGAGVVATSGIVFNSGDTLTVRDCVIRNFTTYGIFFGPNSSTASHVYVSNTLTSDNGRDGIQIDPSGTGPTNGVLNHVEMANNGQDGLTVTGAATTKVTVSDSVSTNNSSAGIAAISNGTTPVVVVNVMVRNSTIANNGVNGLNALFAGATIRVTRSTITGNVTAWLNNLSGIVLSYGDNNIDDNTNANTEPPNPLVYH
jgi:hypothetical protein